MTISVNPFRRRTHTACQWLPDSRSALTSNEGMKENHSGQTVRMAGNHGQKELCHKLP